MKIDFINKSLKRQWIFIFVVLLLVFTLLSTLIYTLFYRNYMLKSMESEWRARGRRIAATLSKHEANWEEQNLPWAQKGYGPGQGKNRGDFGSRRSGIGQYQLFQNAYIKMLNEAMLTDIWVLDKTYGTLSVGTEKRYSFENLPENALENLAKIYEGEEISTTDFSDLLGTSSLTLGFPIHKTDGSIQKSLLIHVSVDDTYTLYSSSFLGFSVAAIIAVILVIILALILSRRFIAPIREIQATTALLARDDYSARTGFNRPDELGDLAAEIDILAHRLEVARSEREQEDSLRRSFISDISHELRTPVAVIRGSIEALVDGIVKPEEQRDYLNAIRNEVKSLDRLVNDLLDLSRLDHKEFALDMTTVRLSDVVSDALRSVRGLAQEREVDLTSELDQELVVEADYGRLRQLSLILLDNAIKYSPMGSQVKIVLARKAAGDAFLSVIDQGPGLMPEVKEHVFDRFYSQSEKKDGMGLGLAIAASIAERHGMSLSVNSQPGQGSEFILAIPESNLKDIEKHNNSLSITSDSFILAVKNIVTRVMCVERS